MLCSVFSDFVLAVALVVSSLANNPKVAGPAPPIIRQLGDDLNAVVTRHRDAASLHMDFVALGLEVVRQAVHDNARRNVTHLCTAVQNLAQSVVMHNTPIVDYTTRMPETSVLIAILVGMSDSGIHSTGLVYDNGMQYADMICKVMHEHVLSEAPQVPMALSDIVDIGEGEYDPFSRSEVVDVPISVGDGEYDPFSRSSL